MSIIVKGMKMPKSCSKCRWFDMGGGYGYQCTLLHKSFDMWNEISVARDKDCPLIEVPTPHGDLVDRGELMDTYADRLTAVAERYSPDSSECGILSGAMKLLAIQPAVIEKEE